MARVCQIAEQLDWYQMDLAEIWRSRIAASEITVTDMRSRMCIALYAVTCDEVDQFAAWLAETMSDVAGDRDHCASEYVHPDANSQAALERERRFCRKYRVISASDIAFSTRLGGTPPFRAISTPQCIWSSSRIECASGLMLMMHPKSSAASCQRQSRSSRHGCALISTTTSCFAQARSTFSISISYPGRR